MTTTTKDVRRCNVCGTDEMPADERARNCGVCKDLPGEAFKAVAQVRKAIALHDVIVKFGGDPTMGTRFPPISRRLAEHIAGVTESSDITWALVSFLGRTDAGK